MKLREYIVLLQKMVTSGTERGHNPLGYEVLLVTKLEKIP